MAIFRQKLIKELKAKTIYENALKKIADVANEEGPYPSINISDCIEIAQKALKDADICQS